MTTQNIRQRVEKMEQRQQMVDASLEVISETQKEMARILDRLVISQEKLIALEIKQQEHREHVRDSFARLESQIVDIRDEQQQQCSVSEERLRVVESQLPSLIESRGWMIAGVGIALVAAVGVLATMAIGK